MTESPISNSSKTATKLRFRIHTFGFVSVYIREQYSESYSCLLAFCSTLLFALSFWTSACDLLRDLKIDYSSESSSYFLHELLSSGCLSSENADVFLMTSILQFISNIDYFIALSPELSYDFHLLNTCFYEYNFGYLYNFLP